VQVHVMLFGQYSQLLATESESGRATIEVAEPCTVDLLLDRLGVPAEGRTYLTVNGVLSRLDAPLADGDEVRVIVPLGGG
jgi:molybdopterin converting factor small subunit